MFTVWTAGTIQIAPPTTAAFFSASRLLIRPFRASSLKRLRFLPVEGARCTEA
jgi:hypothetical protein